MHPRRLRRADEPFCMSDETKALHVNPVGENWEVESETSTLGQAESKPEAIELAKDLAGAEGASRVVVHTSDGQIEQDVTLPPVPPEVPQ
jgi:electron transfer flavoprotein alpha subunit